MSRDVVCRHGPDRPWPLANEVALAPVSTGWNLPAPEGSVVLDVGNGVEDGTAVLSPADRRRLAAALLEGLE